MKFPLSKLLEKVGVEKEEDLSPEEKVVFQRYKVILSGETVSVESIKAFCQAQIKLIEDKIAAGPTLEASPYLAPCLHVYLNLLKAIEAPEQERESLEQHLTQLINS